MAGLADREDDVLGQLRKQKDVGNVRVERVLEERGRLTRGEEDDRSLRVLADCRDLVGRKRRAVRGMEDRLEVASGQRACALADQVRPADELDFGVAPEGFTQLVESFAADR